MTFMLRRQYLINYYNPKNKQLYKLLNYNINEWEYYNTIFKDMFSQKEKTTMN